MNDKPFVYFLPRSDDAAKKKTFLLIQQIPGYPAMISEAASIKEAVAIIRKIGRESPWFRIIIETDCRVGRDLLSRLEPMFSGDPCTTLHLAQLFRQIQERIPEKTFPVDREFLNSVVGLLFSARSRGGQRPCTKMDFLLAKISAESGKQQAPDDLTGKLYSYPICTVPKFFLNVSKQKECIDQSKEALELIPEIMELAGQIARLRQSPFPTSYHDWLFKSTQPVSSAELKSRVDDFIFQVLEGTTSQRKRCSREHPIQTQIVRRVDRFLKAIDIENISIFQGRVALDRYERIRGFLDLILETWTMSLYADQSNKPQIVNLSRLEERHHAAFAQATLAL